MDAHRKHKQKCSRCLAVFEYDECADWPAVSRLVNEHWAVCPYRLNLYGSDPFRPSSEPYPIGSVSSSRQGSVGCSGVDSVKHNDEVIVGYGKQRKTEAERKQELENDEYAYNVQPTSISCHGCEKEISLDKRSRYYPGLWTKHKRKCPGIQTKEKGKLARSNSLCALNTELPPKTASLFETNNRRADGISCKANFVEHGGFREMEWSYDNSEDEDQDHIPFSTLNKRYYNECRERGERWTYRYASMQEIAEQVFTI